MQTREGKLVHKLKKKVEVFLAGQPKEMNLGKNEFGIGQQQYLSWLPKYSKVRPSAQRGCLSPHA